MHDLLKEYLDSEIKAIIKEAGREVSADSSEFNQTAIDWIIKNAAEFREKWNEQHSMNDFSDFN